jgi:beta-phosphoglucomutase-like phosphatase (HAD superfamily)
VLGLPGGVTGKPRYGGVRSFLKAAWDAGLRPAVLSSSTNARNVLKHAGIGDLFKQVIDDAVVRDLAELIDAP